MKALFTALLILLTSVLPVCAEPYPLRTWTSRKGTTIEAQLVRRSGVSVVLLLADGKETMIGTAALSSEDQEYLAQLDKEEKERALKRRAQILANSNRGPKRLAVSPRGDDVDYLTDVENDVIAEMNHARTEPQEYVQFVREYRAQHVEGGVFNTPDGLIRSAEGLKAVDEAIAFLEKVKGVGTLQPSEGLSRAARSHAEDTGPAGITGHNGTDSSTAEERISRQGKWRDLCGENISYGKRTGRDIVVQLIIDDGVPSRGHRTNLFTDKFKVAGVAFAPHKTYGICCVIDYAGGFSF